MISVMGWTLHDQPTRRRQIAALAAVLTLLASSCSDAYTEDEKEKADTGVNPSFVTLYTVANVAPALNELVELYKDERPDTSFLVIANESGTLAANIDDGATPTVWVDTPEAQEPWLGRAAGTPKVIGYDQLEFIVPPGNPGEVTSLRVFGPDASIAVSALCVESQPCGSAARELLTLKGVEAAPDIPVADGAQMLQAVTSAEVDAGLVYRTNAITQLENVQQLPIPAEDPGRIDYQMLPFVPNVAADLFAKWVQESPDAQTVLKRYGLLPLAGALPS